MQIQWYPGHMTKAKRAMKEDIKLIDLVIELVDARVPLGSRNPDIDELAKGKGRIVLLNKADLADDGCTERWIAWFKEQGIHALRINARSGMGIKQIQPLVQEACKEKIERDRRRGIKNRPVRTMVVGIPNVGKSTFINSFAGKACAKTGNKPGVTKGKRYGVTLVENTAGDGEDTKKAWEILCEIARARSCLLKGSELDTKKAAGFLLDDFRSGKLGRVTLEVPEV